jgi:protein subunit release factor A
LKRLDQVLEGDLDEFITALSADEQAARLAEGV